MGSRSSEPRESGFCTTRPRAKEEEEEVAKFQDSAECTRRDWHSFQTHLVSFHYWMESSQVSNISSMGFLHVTYARILKSFMQKRGMPAIRGPPDMMSAFEGEGVHGKADVVREVA